MLSRGTTTSSGFVFLFSSTTRGTTEDQRSVVSTVETRAGGERTRMSRAPTVDRVLHSDLKGEVLLSPFTEVETGSD